MSWSCAVAVCPSASDRFRVQAKDTPRQVRGAREGLSEGGRLYPGLDRGAVSRCLGGS